jgi:hypothetical protein
LDCSDALALKTGMAGDRHRGFESHTLRFLLRGALWGLKWASTAGIILGWVFPGMGTFIVSGRGMRIWGRWMRPARGRLRWVCRRSPSPSMWTSLRSEPGFWPRNSLHCLPDGDEFAEPWELFPRYPADDVCRAYLAEIPRMVAGSDVFEVFGHIDYPVRSWPEALGRFDPKAFEDELRQALRALADGERALEFNARLPLDTSILAWWREEGGRRVTFGSDAHLPQALGAGLAEAAATVEAHGFRPDTKPENPLILKK